MFFGAVWSVYDTATIPWVSDEIAYARSLISLGVPALGICFGGQLLAAAVGGRVERAPDRGDRMAVGRRRHVGGAGPYRCRAVAVVALRPVHRARARCRCVARTALASQAFVSGRTLGLQFHPEVTDAVLEAWLGCGRRGAAQRKAAWTRRR